jgi:hypothetical protein
LIKKIIAMMNEGIMGTINLHHRIKGPDNPPHIHLAGKSETFVVNKYVLGDLERNL